MCVLDIKLQTLLAASCSLYTQIIVYLAKIYLLFKSTPSASALNTLNHKS